MVYSNIINISIHGRYSLVSSTVEVQGKQTHLDLSDSKLRSNTLDLLALGHIYTGYREALGHLNTLDQERRNMCVD